MDDPSGASVNFATSSLGTELQNILYADNLRPGDDPSYQVCKAIYLYHPLGSKMAETPIRLAQSQDREITIPNSPEDDVRKAWQKAWDEFEFSDHILNVMTQARVYGATSIAMGENGSTPEQLAQPIDMAEFWKKDIYFNTLDPLNTAGSLTTSQDPNSPKFQKWKDLTINGTTYHRSRTCTMLNERSFYLAWTTSAYGYVGRSVYQRAFYPMKSFLWTMVTDEMVARKAGLIVARLDQPGSIVDRVWKAMAGVKRSLLKQARTDNVISIGKDEMLETLNMRNVPDSMKMSREDIIKNIATAADMPAKMLTQESFVEGFGEGTQDAYAVAQYVDRIRIEMNRIYEWCDLLCMYKAWNPEFYETIQRRYPKDYGDVEYVTAFKRWQNAFNATWPSLIKEKPSEAVEIEDIKLKALIEIFQVLAPALDPNNRVLLIIWLVDQLNTNEKLFGGALLDLDFAELKNHLNEEAEREQEMGEQLSEEENSAKPPRPGGLQDSTRKAEKAMASITNILDRTRRKAAKQ